MSELGPLYAKVRRLLRPAGGRFVIDGVPPYFPMAVFDGPGGEPTEMHEALVDDLV